MDRTVPAAAAPLLAFIAKTETSRDFPAAYDVVYGHNQARLPKPLTKMTVSEVIAAAAGLDVVSFSGHSLRTGFVTSAADRGADLNRIMDVSRHVDPRTVRSYIRRADRYKDHAGSGFL